MVFSYRRSRWWVWASTFLLIALTTLGPYLSTGETLRLDTDLTNQHVSTELQGLQPDHEILISKRASSAMVGTIMTLLATFDETGVLPPEGTAQANQVIHGLIQLQAAMMKSPASELAAYRKAAVARWMSQSNERRAGAVGDKGLTGRMLAALIAYDVEHPLWDDSRIVLAMRVFNVTRADWIVIVALFHQAETMFHEQGRSFPMAYEFWQMKLSDAKAPQ